MSTAAMNKTTGKTFIYIWILVISFSLAAFFFLSPEGYMQVDVVAIWVLSGIVLIYNSTKESTPLTEKERIITIAIGLLLVLFSFLNIPVGFGKSPYSIGDFSLLLSGISIMIFAYNGNRNLILPVTIPAIAVFGFQAYEHFIRNQEWLTAPLIPPIVYSTVTFLNIAGIRTIVHNNAFSFVSQAGEPINLLIVGDCTGFWSLGTFTISVIIVGVGFPRTFSRKGIMFIILGYLGTVAVNISRIFLISLSGYYYGSRGVIESAHIHIGWLLFASWMVVFWYFFFTRVLEVPLFRKKA